MATAALPAPLQPRRRELIFGTAFATAGVVAVMATLIGYYLAARNAGGADWFSANTIPLTQPNMQALTLAMSVVTMQWAVYAIARDDRTHTYLALGITLLLGAAFVNQSIFLFKQAAVTAVTSLKMKRTVSKTLARQAFHMFGVDRADLVTIEGDPILREDVVRIKASGGADIRIRAEFPEWSTQIRVQ
ncbi:MAG TPA: hypothetical protein PLY51_10650, partial [Microthrixaceae bacterium]|nr:hypothetical protein [Microthrixaceae bacterium]